jgi:hypothetical protein
MGIGWLETKLDFILNVTDLHFLRNVYLLSIGRFVSLGGVLLLFISLANAAGPSWMFGPKNGS